MSTKLLDYIYIPLIIILAITIVFYIPRGLEIAMFISLIINILTLHKYITKYTEVV